MYLLCKTCSKIYKREYALRCPKDYFHPILVLHKSFEHNTLLFIPTYYNLESLNLLTCNLQDLSSRELLEVKKYIVEGGNKR